jgi:DNA-binding NtrC family response regulator
MPAPALKSATKQILIAEDEPNLRRVLGAQLQRDGYEVLLAEDGAQAMALLGEHHVDVIISDLRMPKVDGLSFLKHVVAEKPDVPFLLITAHGTVETAVEALKLGAFDYVTKPFDRAELKTIVDKAARTRDLIDADAAVLPKEAALDEGRGRFRLIGREAPMRDVYAIIEKVADTPSTVLITGESGTGKELVARALHENSSRKAGPLIRVNCAAIPRDLIESELFGYEKGAFTGAVTSKPGRFELAHGGTLFLDEIGECDPLLQTKLLRVLQPPPGKGPCHREFRPVGGHQPRTADVRLVAATNRDLQAEIQAQRFREDLYYRLAVITLELPPLRNRPADIPLLAHRFLDQINHEFERDEPGFEYKKLSAAAIEFVKRFEWPGNVRQLYNALVQAAVLAEGHVLERSDFVAALGEIPDKRLTGVSLVDRPLGDGFDIEEHLNGIQREYLRRAMKESRGVKTQAARLLGMKNYQTLDAQLKRLDVSGVWGE